MKLGYKIYYNKNTPKVIRKIMETRWQINSTIIEHKRRKKHLDHIFLIPFEQDKMVKFYLPLKGEIIEKHLIVTNEFFEKENLEIIKNYIPKKATIIDVGANIGNHTIFFSLLDSDNRIYSFEPHHINYEILLKNIKLNNLHNVKTYPLAVGDKKGKGNLIELPNKNLSDTMVEYDSKGEISFISLDEFVKNEKLEKIDLVKIDVEGFEENVIKGMLELAKKYDPIYWIEIWNDNKETIFKLLRKNYFEEIKNDEFNINDNYLFKKAQEYNPEL
ncbi:MAG: FkbM family methyltransferase [Clostridiales bacterium]|nr:FkbM family methyltransferase [Clostridiales bacterium]